MCPAFLGDWGDREKGSTYFMYTMGWMGRVMPNIYARMKEEEGRRGKKKKSHLGGQCDKKKEKG